MGSHGHCREELARLRMQIGNPEMEQGRRLEENSAPRAH